MENTYERLGKKESDECAYCVETDTPRHTVFVCDRWERERAEAIKSWKNWGVIMDTVTKIMKEKEEEMRQERKEEERTRRGLDNGCSQKSTDRVSTEKENKSLIDSGPCSPIIRKPIL
ncbi:hypothetical protein NQ317_017896 [Molorchus minor]|uniref:Reverse transcriptase zinc-binding domain-containing protein n=1 Tax=Molorchus minor TaxID=1323400 RepID=A0ABQ9IY59_9CUCU|nr:hypothetical protein NQ317_017896 [Molorchus minor]